MKRIDGVWLKDSSAQKFMAALEDEGHTSYFVGGCVRNAVLGLPVTDLDIATNARPDKVTAVAKAHGFKPVPTGIEHGTVTVVGSTQALEVTTFRKDVETDGRHAVVAFSNRLEDDAARRDFRMNAIYADRHGALTDPVAGLADIDARQIVFVGEAEQRIREDYLRIIRLYRFAAQLGFGARGIDVAASAASAKLSEGLGRVSAERLTAEMLKLLSAAEPLETLEKMVDDGVLAQVLPDSTMEIFERYQANDCSANPVGRLAALVPAEAEMPLRLSKKERKLWELLGGFARSDQTGADLAYRTDAKTAQMALALRAAVRDEPAPSALEVKALSRAEAQVFPLRAKDLVGLDGKALGAALKMAEAAWIASDFRLDKDALLKLAAKQR